MLLRSFLKVYNFNFQHFFGKLLNNINPNQKTHQKSGMYKKVNFKLLYLLKNANNASKRDKTWG